jgi:hypothetical protein
MGACLGKTEVRTENGQEPREDEIKTEQKEMESSVETGLKEIETKMGLYLQSEGKNKRNRGSSGATGGLYLRGRN